jgi:transcriptional regulator with XRE-family HTH domain
VQRLNVNARGIGMELAMHRRVAGMTLEQVSKRLGMSFSTLSRLENGKREPTIEEVAGILAILGVVGEERNQLLARARGGACSCGLVVHGGSNIKARIYQSFEAEAVGITNFEPWLVPGLAQTAAYAKAVMSAIRVDRGDSEVEQAVGQRMARKAIFTRKRPPRLNLIMTELALRQPAGGLGVMAGQLRHLVDLAGQDHVSVRIIPLAAPVHPGLWTPLVIFDFDGDSSLVFLEGHMASLYRDDPEEVAAYREYAGRLSAVALDKAGSVELMRSISDDLDRA